MSAQIQLIALPPPPDTGSSSDGASSESLPEITIPDDSLSYLKGKFYGGGGTLTIDGKSLKWEGDSTLSLKPTSVDTIVLGSLLDTTSTKKEVTAIYFDAAYNDGVSYCVYADVLDDGYLHLTKKNGDKYETIATFQPDLAKYAGCYSAWGDGNVYNYYEIVDSSFDADRNVYPMTRYYPGASMWSGEQNWYFIGRIRSDSDDNIYYTLEFYDSDDYGYGEYEALASDTGLEIYDLTWEMTAYYADAGAFNCLSLFDGATKSNISVSVDVDAKTIDFGDKSGTYEIAYDDSGMYLNVTFSSESAKLRLKNRHLLYEANGVTTIYPISAVDELEGAYTNGVNTVSAEFDYDDNDDYVLKTVKWNGEAVEYAFVIENNRKSISFTSGGVNYIISPDKGSSSVRVNAGGTVSYYINGERYDALFQDSFVAHDKDHDYTLSVNNDFSYTLNGNKGSAVYSYKHGDKFPSLTLTDTSGTKTLNLVQEDIGLFSLADGSDAATLYSQTVLDKVYGTYSSNSKDSFVINSDSITYAGVHYDYEFAPSFQEKLGYYYFGVSSSLGDFESNLAGCVYSDKISFVSKDIFGKIAGTYSLYGKYGIENIKMSEDGVLTLDTANEAGDGLDRDVEYSYQIITTGDKELAVLGFPYGDYTILIYIYEDYATIAGLNYYKENITLTWGVYLDEAGENILYADGNKLYYNGSEVSIYSKSSLGSNLVYDTDQGIIAISADDDGASATIISDGSVTTLTRKYNFTDYSKFVGEYTANDTAVVFSKTTTSYEATIGDTKVSFDSMKFVLRDGKVAIEIPYLSAKYYLVIDPSTGAVTCDYEAGSIPVPPPLPF